MAEPSGTSCLWTITPGVKCVDYRGCFFLPYSAPEIRLHLTHFSLNFVQARDVVQCFFGDVALVGRMQIEKFATRMGQPISVTPSSKHSETVEDPVRCSHCGYVVENNCRCRQAAVRLESIVSSGAVFMSVAKCSAQSRFFPKPSVIYSARYILSQ